MSVKGKLIQYQLDEIFFHLSDRIWFLMMLEVFPQQGIDTISSNVIILRALKYIFSTLRVQECIKLEEMDDVLNYFMGGKKDAKTVRGVREQIVGYDHTQKYELYEELYLEHECLEPVIQKLNKRHKKTEDLFQKILEHINESYQKMRFDNIKEYLMIRGTYIRKPAGPAGLGWFLQKYNEEMGSECIFAFDRKDLTKRKEEVGGGDNANGITENTSTRKNIEVVWDAVINVDKKIRDSNSKYKEEFRMTLQKCREDHFQYDAYKFLNDNQTEVKIGKGQSVKVESFNNILVDLIRTELREKGFNDSAPGLFQKRPLNEQGAKIDWADDNPPPKIAQSSFSNPPKEFVD